MSKKSRTQREQSKKGEQAQEQQKRLAQGATPSPTEQSGSSYWKKMTALPIHLRTTTKLRRAVRRLFQHTRGAWDYHPRLRQGDLPGNRRSRAFHAPPYQQGPQRTIACCGSGSLDLRKHASHVSEAEGHWFESSSARHSKLPESRACSWPSTKIHLIVFPVSNCMRCASCDAVFLDDCGAWAWIDPVIPTRAAKIGIGGGTSSSPPRLWTSVTSASAAAAIPAEAGARGSRRGC